MVWIPGLLALLGVAWGLLQHEPTWNELKVLLTGPRKPLKSLFESLMTSFISFFKAYQLLISS